MVQGDYCGGGEEYRVRGDVRAGGAGGCGAAHRDGEDPRPGRSPHSGLRFRRYHPCSEVKQARLIEEIGKSGNFPNITFNKTNNAPSVPEAIKPNRII